MRIRQTAILLILIMGAACAPVPTSPTPDLVSTVVAATLTAQVPPFTPIPTLTPAAVATAFEGPAPADTQEFTSYYVLTSTENVNLRTKPGTLFPVSRVMAQGTNLQVVGVAPGGEWLNVVTDEKIIGWVQINFVAGGGHDGPPPPFVYPTQVQMLSGRVTDEAGGPVSGVGFAITKTTASDSPRTDAATDETGTFYAWLPLSANGTWYVTYVSIACTSNVMDANCQCLGGACGKPQPSSHPVTLPVDTMLTFVWK